MVSREDQTETMKPSDFREMFIQNTRTLAHHQGEKNPKLDLMRRLRSVQHPSANLVEFRHQRICIPPSHRCGVYLRA